MNSGIYKITNLIDNKIYIGSAFNLKRRKNQHFKVLSLNKHGNNYLQNSYNKHGKDNFKFQVLEDVPMLPNETKSEFKLRLVNEREQFYLNTLLYAQEYIKNESNKFKELGYNINPIAYSSLGRKMSEKQHEVLMYHVKYNSNYGMRNKKHTEEAIQKMKVPRSDEFKEKCRIIKTGSIQSEISKQKNRESHLGKKHNEEAKKKISQNHSDTTGVNNPMYGKKHTEETKKKMSNANFGKKWSKETHQKFALSNNKSIKIEYNNETFNSLKELYRSKFINIMSINTFYKRLKDNIIIIKKLNKNEN